MAIDDDDFEDDDEIELFENYEDGEIGYVVVEADDPGTSADEILTEMRELEGTVRARIIYDRA